MKIEKAKAELQAATSGPGGIYWRYTPAISTVLAALERAERQIAKLEARKLVPVMYKGMELLKKDGLELIRDGLAEVTELESMCMAGALLSAMPAQPIKVPDEREAFNAWNNDIDCPLAGRDAKTAAWLGWSRRAAMLTAAPGKED